MAHHKQKVSLPVFDLLLTLFGIASGIGGIIVFSGFKQLGYILITIGLFLLFFNVWRQIKKQLKDEKNSNKLLLIVNVFSLALCVGVILGYFVLGLVQ